MFYRLSADYCLGGTLALASHTGWAESEIHAMRVSRFMDYLNRLPKRDGE